MNRYGDCGAPKDEFMGAREEIVMLHKALTPKEQAMMRAAMDRAFEEEMEWD